MAQRCPPEYTQHPEYAVAALLHMLVRYPMVECGCMAESIGAHLQAVATDARLPDVLRETAAQSLGEWDAMLEMRAALARHK